MVEEAFIFVPWRVIGNWSMRTIGVLLKRAFLSIVTSALPSYERRGGVRSLSSSRLDDYRSAKTNYFPRWNARSFPALVSIRTSFHIRVMKITRVPKRERERDGKDKLKLLRDSPSFDSYFNFIHDFSLVSSIHIFRPPLGNRNVSSSREDDPIPREKRKRRAVSKSFFAGYSSAREEESSNAL